MYHYQVGNLCVYMCSKMANSEDEGEKPQKGHDNKSCPICGHGPYKDGRSGGSKIHVKLPN